MHCIARYLVKKTQSTRLAKVMLLMYIAAVTGMELIKVDTDLPVNHPQLDDNFERFGAHNGLKPNSNGLHHSSDGLQPNSEQTKRRSRDLALTMRGIDTFVGECHEYGRRGVHQNCNTPSNPEHRSVFLGISLQILSVTAADSI